MKNLYRILRRLLWTFRQMQQLLELTIFILCLNMEKYYFFSFLSNAIGRFFLVLKNMIGTKSLICQFARNHHSKTDKFVIKMVKIFLHSQKTNLSLKFTNRMSSALTCAFFLTNGSPTLKIGEGCYLSMDNLMTNGTGIKAHYREITEQNP